MKCVEQGVQDLDNDNEAKTKIQEDLKKWKDLEEKMKDAKRELSSFVMGI